jgi:hypothetical protein
MRPSVYHGQQAALTISPRAAEGLKQNCEDREWEIAELDRWLIGEERWRTASSYPVPALCRTK